MSKALKIYHITHINNIANILHNGRLLSDAKMRESMQLKQDIGMSHIKQRRLNRPVSCHPDTTVGEYVPFYFCPRSVMLYILHKSNHGDLAYSGGQEPILHLQIDLEFLLAKLEKHHIKWAFTDCNAGALYAQFFNQRNQLQNLDWEAIYSPNFKSPHVKDAKQAEFLVYKSVPLGYVEKIGVHNSRVQKQVIDLCQAQGKELLVEVQKNWYYD